MLHFATSRNRIEQPTRAIVGFGAAGIGGGDNRASADAGDAVQGDAVLLEDAKDAGVRNSAGETAAKRQADARLGRRPCPHGLEGGQTMYRRGRSASSSHIITADGR